MKYHQLTFHERYLISKLRKQRCSQAEIARMLDRHRSTISREVYRNRVTWHDAYKAGEAQMKCNARRRKSRRNQQFSTRQLLLVIKYLRLDYSPEQIAGTLKRHSLLSISHETIYQFIWADKRCGGDLYKHLRCATKQRRKRSNAYDSRGRLAGKRMIDTRPKIVETRRNKGHWEIDTVMGGGDRHCIVTIVERKTGYVLIGKLKNRKMDTTNKRTIDLIKKHGFRFSTITADNGTEFHTYEEVEKETGVKYYFAHPYHSWERGTNENTNGLIRQYLPKKTSMAQVTQHQCNAIARKLNTRPRKRHNYKTPEEMMNARI
jgi:IS30 family transposase